MNALRNYVYSLDAAEINNVLKQFDIELPKEPYGIALVKFEVITPDSFMWRLKIADKVYYLYAEDYIQDSKHLKKVFDSYIGNADWKFISPLPQYADNSIKNALKSGYDYVFLVSSSEDVGMVLFSDSSAQGYSPH